MARRKSEWMPLREAVEIPGFRRNRPYPAKFPNVVPQSQFGYVLAGRGQVDFYSFNADAIHEYSLDLSKPLLKPGYSSEAEIGGLLAGDVLILRSIVEEARA